MEAHAWAHAEYRRTHRKELSAKENERREKLKKSSKWHEVTKRVAKYRAGRRPIQRDYSRNRVASLTDGYVREALHKMSRFKLGNKCRAAKDFTAAEVESKRKQMLARRGRPNKKNLHLFKTLAAFGAISHEQK